MRKILALILFLILFSPTLFVLLFRFPSQENQVLAQTCQDGDEVCPSGCTPENDNDCCGLISIIISPEQETYEAGEVINLKITGLGPEYEDGVTLHYTRTSANTQDSSVWTEIPLSYIPPSFGGYWQASWTIPDDLFGPFPYDESKNQEFFLVMNLIKDGQFLCSGNPDPGIVPGHPEIERALCENCWDVLVTREEPVSPTLNMDSFWNITPGYSFTYEGRRLDETRDDDGHLVDGGFATRMEYEAPIELCDGITVVPQRFTKSNRWGYWNPANPDPSQRINMWTKGEHNLRFLVTSPEFEYFWNSNFFGSVGHKCYKQNGLANSEVGPGGLGIFDGTMIYSALGYENYYYPPYLLSLSQSPDSDVGKFVRIDSIYRIWDNGNTEKKEEVCDDTRQKKEDHYWYARFQLLTDTEIKGEFDQILSYFPNPEDRKIAVVTFFESTAEGVLTFREDWYLMESVGLVGVDQASWDPVDTVTAGRYFDADFMKRGTDHSPHMAMRARSAYLGEPLTISASPTVMAPGESYTLTARGANSSMPYDGQLESEDGGTVHLWRSAIDGEPMWVENGSVVFELPKDFPTGEYTVSYRSHITRSPSGQETIIPPSEMPWSNEVAVVVRVRGDLDNDGDADGADAKILLSRYGTNDPEADLNSDGLVNGIDFGELSSMMEE